MPAHAVEGEHRRVGGTRRLVNHAPTSDITEGYAADWTVGQLREPAQRIAEGMETLMHP